MDISLFEVKTTYEWYPRAHLQEYVDRMMGDIESLAPSYTPRNEV